MGDIKRILILGGGYGGVWAGKILERRFRKREDVELTLVDMRPFHTLMTELHEVAGWRAEPESVQVDFRKIFGAKKINCVIDRIEKVDFESKKAVSARNVYPFDYIVVGSGAEPEFFGIPGVKEHSFTLWSFDDAMRIRNHLEQIFSKAARETDPAARARLLTFIVAGAGFTGIEMIGELLEYRDAMCRKHHLDPKECRVINIEALSSVLPILEEPLCAKAETYLRKKGCEIMLDKAIVGAEEGKVLLKDGDAIETETFIWTCGVKGSDFAGSLAVPMAGKRNRVETDAEMKSPKHPFAYFVGDNAGLMVDGKPMAQIVESAHFSAEAAAGNIIADIDGGERHSFRPNYHGFMVSIGGRYGVANAGGMKTSGFIAMAMKHMINMYYLFRIAGFNQVWEYFKHEFLDMKSGRSIVGGFLSYKVRGYWPLLLRMWLGFMWIVEGANKVKEGWLNFADGKSRSGWLFSTGVVQAGLQAADDATSAATAIAATPAIADATSAATAAAAAPAIDATAAASAAAGWGQAASDAAASTAPGLWFDPTAIIFKPDGAVATWFRTTFMDGVFSHIPYTWMQLMIVVLELGIGLALFGGFFTWFAAVASIGMCIVFTLSGMFSWDRLWFVFAAILMMGGAGRAFGLDYWSVPLFKRWWNGTRLARRSHLYGDDPTK